MDKSKFNNLKEIKKFTTILGIVLIIIATVQLIIGSNLTSFFYSASLIILAIGFTFPVLMKPIFIIFVYFSFAMNWIMTKIILSLLFYFVFTPIGIISRLVGKRYLDTILNKKQESYWLDTSVEQQKEKSYENQF